MLSMQICNELVTDYQLNVFLRRSRDLLETLNKTFTDRSLFCAYIFEEVCVILRQPSDCLLQRTNRQG